MKKNKTQQLAHAASQLNSRLGAKAVASILHRPLFILSAPRSGSSLLFELLSKQKGLWSIGQESHLCYATLPHLRFENAQKDSAVLTEHHADQKTRELLLAEWLFLARDHNQKRFIKIPHNDRPDSITLLEKTPRNAFNIRFLNALFPNAIFIYLHRRAEHNIASIMEAWGIGLKSDRFSTYPNLPGWDRDTWCLVLPRGWRAMKGKSIARIAAFQWEASNLAIMSQLSELDLSRRITVSYEQLVDEPQQVINSIARFAGLVVPSTKLIPQDLPLSKMTVTPPCSNKWKLHERDVRALMPELDDCSHRISFFE